MDELLDQIRRGDRRCLARAMTLVDGAGPDASELKDRLRLSTGDVPWWGVTGPPGVGKSTLIDALISRLRRRGRRVGVVAIDPTSPVSNGALLGDRVRMMRHAIDRDVFIRSLATHGREGGLSDAALHCARLLELASYDPVVIETVGVGQNEVDIASVADVCVVVLGPGYGDDIQLIKAGLLEIADIVVVNKCDLAEASRLLGEVHAVLAGVAGHRAVQASGTAPALCPTGMDPSGLTVQGLRGDHAGRVSIFGVEAQSGQGVDELLDALLEADSASRESERRAHGKRRRLLGEIRQNIRRTCEEVCDRRLNEPAAESLVTALQCGDLSLHSVTAKLLADVLAVLREGPPDSTNGLG